MNMIKIKRALLSVTDKEGLSLLAKELCKAGVELIASDGTGRFLQSEGIPFTPLSEVTGYNQAFDGRCKSLSVQIMGSLLFDREKHSEEAEELGVVPIDLVVCNLYDFYSVWRGEADVEKLVEQIDIGGVALLRASAKNHRFVVSLSTVADYGTFVRELEENQGHISVETSKRLAIKSFVKCSEYDRMIALGLSGSTLRYGENPHQSAWNYPVEDFAFAGLRQLQGKSLSYNNFLDIKAGLDCAREQSLPACVIIKHGNPCGVAIGESGENLLSLAWAGDSVSAFGSVVVFSYAVTRQDLSFMCLEEKAKTKFVEAVIAPEFSSDALEYLGQKKKLAVCSYDRGAKFADVSFKQLDSMLIAQEVDVAGQEDLQVIVGDESGLDKELALFGTRVVKALLSNAVTIVYRDGEDCLRQISMGCGQPNRLDAIYLAVQKLKRAIEAGNFTGKPSDCYLVSDAFLPFADNVEAIAGIGIKTIVQPGGSIRDHQVIEACEKLSVRMVFTGVRHFRH